MEFIVGCNYWASNAGTEMWRDFDEKVIREDLEILSSHGIRCMRVFPNWRDFQPVMAVYGPGGNVAGYKLFEDREPENKYFLDEKMMERFGIFCKLCKEYNITLIVGLITGWMSGRLFLPPALQGKNIMKDSIARYFAQMFIKGFVKRFKDEEAIYAWDLGNECNGIGGAEERFDAAAWTEMIANAIRSNDNTRPVVSGMHSLGLDNTWTIDDQAEACDILTTHPYPLWVRLAYKDYTASFRTLIHATCETKYYSNIGNKPCLAEEIGTMGPMICDDETAADFIRLNYISNWANGALGVMWWCANEQIDLDSDPYSRNTCETELGMIDRYRNPKPVLKETKRMEKIISDFDFELPKATEDAVCLLTAGQDNWAATYMTYGLAKQAGLNISFAYSINGIPKADTYIVPSTCGTYIMPKNRLDQLRKNISEGAIAYFSIDTAMFPAFRDLFGMKVRESGNFNDLLTVNYKGVEIPFSRGRRYVIEEDGAEVIARDSLGIPAVTKYNYGKGTVYFVNFPLETMLVENNNAFDDNHCIIYKDIFKDLIKTHQITTDNKYVGITLHPDTNGDIYCVAVNYSGKEQTPDFKIKDGYKITEVYYGNVEKLDRCDSVVFKISK